MAYEKSYGLVSNGEKNDIDRLVLVWANKFPGIPQNVPLIKYEYFAAKTEGMSLSSAQGARIVKKFITGRYRVEYAFEIHYQIAPSGTSDNRRLNAVEALNSFADWAKENKPNIGKNRVVRNMEVVSYAAYLGASEDLYEDYFIPLKLTYEVI